MLHSNQCLWNPINVTGLLPVRLSKSSLLQLRPLFHTALLLALLLIFTNSLAAPPPVLEDVVYLKNGSLIRGTIMEQIPGETIKIQTRDGNLLVYKMSEVLKITKEARPVPVTKPAVPGKTKPAASGYLFNPLGFLQFGPTFELEFASSPTFVWGPRVRYDSLGLLNHVAGIIDYEDISMANFAFGGGFKAFFLKNDTLNHFYLGGAVEYGMGTGYDDKGLTNEFKGEWSYLALLTNFGYRWRSESGFRVNLGVISGFAQGLKDEGYYTGGSGGGGNGIIYEYDTETVVFGMLECSLGKEF